MLLTQCGLQRGCRRIDNRGRLRVIHLFDTLSSPQIALLASPTAKFATIGEEKSTGSDPGTRLMLRDQFVDDLAGDIRQAHVASLVAECQLQMIQPQQVQERGMQVVDMHSVFHSVVTQFVGFS